jgi:hypothetical protein
MPSSGLPVFKYPSALVISVSNSLMLVSIEAR